MILLVGVNLNARNLPICPPLLQAPSWVPSRSRLQKGDHGPVPNTAVVRTLCILALWYAFSSGICAYVHAQTLFADDS